MTLGEKIQLCRKKKGLSQEDLANLLNVSRQAVQKWESDAAKPELSKIVEISNVFDVSTDYLLKGIEEKDITTIQNNERNDNLYTKQESPSIKHLEKGRYKAIKVWMIIGCVLTPMFAGGSYLNNQYKPEALLFLLLYLVTIPLCVLALNKCKKAQSQSELIAFGVVCALFVSFIGGILMVSSGDKFFVADRPKTKEELENEARIAALAKEEEQRKLELRKKAEEEQRAKERVEQMRVSARQKILTSYSDFASKKYNPCDKEKASKEKEKAFIQINKTSLQEEMNNVVFNYKSFLASFSLDEVFYLNLKRKRIKRLVIFSIVIASIGACIGTGFGISAIAKEVNRSNTYNAANELMEDGNYSGALAKYTSLGNYKDSENKISVCNGLIELESSITSKNQSSIISGIKNIIKGKETVEVNYKSSSGKTIRNKKPKAGADSTTVVETIDSYDFSLLVPPVNNGYTFKQWFSDALSYSNNQTHLFLDSEWLLNTYRINYYLDGGSNSIENPTTYTFESPTITLRDPNKEGHIFKGWFTDSGFNNQITNIETGSFEELNIYAKWEIIVLKVKFYNYDNSFLWETNVNYGNNVLYSGVTPTREGTESHHYVWTGWDKSLQNIKQDTNFVATFDYKINEYSVVFKNYDETILHSMVVEHGSDAIYPSSLGDPTRPADNTFAYYFAGWDIDLTNVKENKIAHALYSTKDRFKCQFNNWDGAELYTMYVTENENAVYSGETPKKEKTAQYSYIFSGWDKPLNNITDHTVFVAQFNQSVNSYTIIFKNYNGTTLQSNVLEYGETPVFSGDTPKKEADNTYYYEFSGWDSEITSVTGNKTYKATFNSVEHHLSVGTTTYKVFNFKTGLRDEISGNYVNSYTGDSSSPFIPETINGKNVIVIGANTFKDNEYIQQITIPNRVVCIGNMAFYNCINLTQVSIDRYADLQDINSEAFSCEDSAPLLRHGSINYINFILPYHIYSLSKYFVKQKLMYGTYYLLTYRSPYQSGDDWMRYNYPEYNCPNLGLGQYAYYKFAYYVGTTSTGSWTFWSDSGGEPHLV